MADTTRTRLIGTAMRLFAEKGYAATSVADIARSAGAHTGSLYHFFPAKQDLLIAVLQEYRAGIREMLLEPAWLGVDDPIERIFALLAAYRTLLTATDCSYGCPIGSLALELHEPDPQVRELLAANFQSWTAAVRECLDAARDRFSPDMNMDQLAVLILSTMEGGVMLSRTERTIDAFDNAVAALRSCILASQHASVPV